MEEEGKGRSEAVSHIHDECSLDFEGKVGASAAQPQGFTSERVALFLGLGQVS